MNVPMKWCAAVLLGGVMVAGCGEDTDDNAVPSAPPPGSTPTAPQAQGTSEAIQQNAQDAAAALKSEAQQAADTAKADASAAAGQLTAEQADVQIQQVMTYIKENKLELAETTLQQLEKNKTSLPAAVQPQVDNARKMLDAAKAKGAPGAPATPGAQPAAPAPAPAPAQ